ncbi:hypothetical protein Ahu01nite_003160 [Winogradskya humida]|uniref:Uncharacterized protein n=1 Tax=Winogradskya humida TaxID=113566 RepID=A0ABQ3ZF82_9ACTN|nr:hypothetical protein Ahu01nite_003160 [Actinoplanes humidus]
MPARRQVRVLGRVRVPVPVLGRVRVLRWVRALRRVPGVLPRAAWTLRRPVPVTLGRAVLVALRWVRV